MAIPSRVQMVHVRRRACPLAGRSGGAAESVSLDFCIARPCLSMVSGLVQTTVEAYSTAAICAT